MDSEFEASLVYIVSSRTARTSKGDPISKNQEANVLCEQEKALYPFAAICFILLSDFWPS